MIQWYIHMCVPYECIMIILSHCVLMPCYISLYHGSRANPDSCPTLAPRRRFSNKKDTVPVPVSLCCCWSNLWVLKETFWTMGGTWIIPGWLARWVTPMIYISPFEVRMEVTSLKSWVIFTAVDLAIWRLPTSSTDSAGVGSGYMSHFKTCFFVLLSCSHT